MELPVLKVSYKYTFLLLLALLCELHGKFRIIRRKWNKRCASSGSLVFVGSEKAAIENISLKSVNNFQDAKTSRNVIKDIQKMQKVHFRKIMQIPRGLCL